MYMGAVAVLKYHKGNRYQAVGKKHFVALSWDTNARHSFWYIVGIEKIFF